MKPCKPSEIRASTSCFSRPLHGFTLVELLVVIAIIGVLVAMLLPAVQAAREAARRSQCTNNQKQLALGALNYENSFKHFPMGMTVTPWVSTWIVRIMPYMELNTIADQWNYTLGYSDYYGINGELLRVKYQVLQCPSDETLPWPAPTSYESGNYVACFSPSGKLVEPGAKDFPHDTCYDDPTRNPAAAEPTVRYALYNVNRTREPREVVDGSSNTIGFSEVISVTTSANDGARTDIRGAWWHPFGAGYTHHRTPNTSIPDDAFQGPDYCTPIPEAPCTKSSSCWSTTDNAARSRHPGGVMAARADGSVDFYSDDIDLLTWQALASMNGGDAE